MGLGAKPPKFFKNMFYFLVSTESLKKYCHILISQKFGGGGQTDWWGGLGPPGPYGSYGPDYSYSYCR